MKHEIKIPLMNKTNNMKNTLMILGMAIITMSSCKDKIPKTTKSYELSEEMMAYFVDYEVGTQWIYQDTLDANNYDTIELVSKENFDVNIGNGTLTKGFVLYYKPKKSKDFKVRIDPGANNMYYVKVDPMATAAGAIIFENNNGTWTTGVTYYDSIEITGTKYYHVINSKSSNSFQQDMSISKAEGIVSFWKTRGPGALEHYHKLIRTIKP